MIRRYLACALAVLAACGSGDGASPADQAMEGLCAALASLQQESPDREVAEAEFRDLAHEPLHELAALVEDRAVKADLLEAKGAVENGDVSEEALVEVMTAVEAAAEAADLERPGPCDG